MKKSRAGILVAMLVGALIASAFMWLSQQQQPQQQQQEQHPVVIQNTIQQNNNDTRIDEMYDPYVPPYRDDSYVYRVAPVPTVYVGPVIEYRQIGLLTPTKGPTEDRLLPLMGRPLYRSGTKWQYYTMSNGHTPLKLPIHVRGKVATNDYGVDELDTGDHVHVEGHKEPFEVRSY